MQRNTQSMEHFTYQKICNRLSMHAIQRNTRSKEAQKTDPYTVSNAIVHKLLYLSVVLVLYNLPVAHSTTGSLKYTTSSMVAEQFNIPLSKMSKLVITIDCSLCISTTHPVEHCQ